MAGNSKPYAMPQTLEGDLARVHAYWQGLERGQANMPFSDDVKTAALPGLAGQLLLIDVFHKPPRFRLGTIGQEIADQYGEDVSGRFLDQVEPKNPLENLAAQCEATLADHAPTYWRHIASGKQTARSYARLLLPMWGDGHVNMLLGAIALLERV